jgi:ribonuclease HII
MLPTTIDDIPDGVWASIDEVGRGAFAGEVCAAVVVWSKDYIPATPGDEKLLGMIKDSKKLSQKHREKLAIFIKEHCLEYAVCCVDNEEIDRINILQATYKAMHGALDKIKVRFDRVIVDGDKFKPYMTPEGEFVPHTCVVQGDAKLLQIAAASIIAKDHRDRLIAELSCSDPTLQVYDWASNKGYGTAKHREAIVKHGLSPYHRRTFIHFV